MIRWRKITDRSWWEFAVGGIGWRFLLQYDVQRKCWWRVQIGPVLLYHVDMLAR